MLNRLLIALLTVLALALAPGAAAKGIEGATVCGVDACTSAGRDDLGPALMGGTPTMPPTEAAPWYRAKLEMGDGRPGGRVYETFGMKVLPQSGYIAMRDGYGGSSWSEMSSAQQAIYTRLTSGIEPFPAEELKGIAAPEPPVSTAGDEESSSLPWILIGAGIAALVAAVFVARIRRRRTQPVSAG